LLQPVLPVQLLLQPVLPVLPLHSVRLFLPVLLALLVLRHLWHLWLQPILLAQLPPVLLPVLPVQSRL
jgi:hypothetical protein